MGLALSHTTFYFSHASGFKIIKYQAPGIELKSTAFKPNGWERDVTMWYIFKKVCSTSNVKALISLTGTYFLYRNMYIGFQYLHINFFTMKIRDWYEINKA